MAACAQVYVEASQVPLEGTLREPGLPWSGCACRGPREKQPRPPWACRPARCHCLRCLPGVPVLLGHRRLSAQADAPARPPFRLPAGSACTYLDVRCLVEYI